MTHNELLALAAHLHVMIRRKIGRITDPEWMVSNPDYAREIVRLARSDSSAELIDAVQRFESAMFDSPHSAPPKPLLTQLKENLSRAPEGDSRYVGHLR